MSRLITQLYASHKGKISDKWASYLPVYDQLFAYYQNQPINFLEIGIQNGGSLEIWSKFFSHAKTIVGCDIDPLCKNLTYSDKRISVVVGDANENSTAEAITSKNKNFDIIIDDGSHVANDMIKTFSLYFPLLSPGGIFIIEDTHCMYWESHQGGIQKKSTAHQFFKLLSDQINYEFWKKDFSLENLFLPYFSELPVFLSEGWIESVEFRNSMIIIKKIDSQSPCFPSLGKRLIVGSEAIVVPQSLALQKEMIFTEKVKRKIKSFFKQIIGKRQSYE